ncbi:MAG: TIGR01777 family protein [Chitinophagia bacterium]|nr:TIGR01777 family protein [Chitinophagia bacterium]
MATILITGGTGMVGQALAALLSASGNRVIIITRSIPVNTTAKSFSNEYVLWNPDEYWIEPTAIQQADYIIHLAGAGVADKRWTRQRKQEILQSRVNGCKTLVKALESIPHKVKAVLSASAIGWYGWDTEKSIQSGFTENDPPDTAFLGDTCFQWEKSIEPVKQLNTRLVIFRIGIVLDKAGGALPEFLKPLHFRVASVLGNGKQIISWIHLHDLCNLFLFAINNPAVEGVYNAVAPHPLSNRLFNRVLASYLYDNKYITLPVPKFVLQIMLGEMSVEVLKSTKVSSRKIQNAGFVFQYPELQDAIRQILPNRTL